MRAVDPYTGKPGAEYREHSRSDVEEILTRTSAAAAAYGLGSLDERCVVLRRAAQILREEKGDLAELMTQEMGKPLSGGLAEVEKCAWVCEFYAERGPSFLAPESIDSDAAESFVCYRPLGVVLAVMPWNFPLWQVFRAAAPILLAGNAMVLKHASNVPGCALRIAEIWRRAGLPDDVFSTVLVGSSQVAHMIESPSIHAVTLTGSTPAGRAVAAKAGEQLKKCVLELGGNDPYLILRDANLQEAALACVTSRLINSGQSCIAAKRFVVVKEHYQRFVDLVVDAMQEAAVGDPRIASTLVGPMARHDLRDELHEQVQRSVAEGARCVLGGQIPDHPGAMYPPTVLRDVTRGMTAYHEELFGPVASLICADDEEHAISLANDSDFGLGAAVFTQDTARGRAVAADKLQAGACFVNAFVRSDPRLPFGGIKDSGFGRELAAWGVREFTNLKTVYVA